MKTIEELHRDEHAKKIELQTRVAAITGKLSAYHSILDELNARTLVRKIPFAIVEKKRDESQFANHKQEIDLVLVKLGDLIDELRDARQKSY